MILKILLYGLLIYLVYRYVVLPVLGGKRGNNKRGNHIHYRKKEDTRDRDQGEYIDYEEVKENE